MSFKPQDRPEINQCPQAFLDVADSVDIQKTFDYLEKEFHLAKKFRKEFKVYLSKTSRNISEPEAFVRFAKQHFEQALNVIIQREHSVVLVLGYILKSKLDEKRKEDEAMRRFYRSDEWKKGGSWKKR